MAHRFTGVGFFLLVLLSGGGCERMSPRAQGGAETRLLQSEMVVYERGHLREIELTRAALQLVRQSSSDAQHAVLESATDPSHMQSDAARALGMTPDDYARIVRHVDSALLADTSSAGFASAQHLDSMRVTLVVLRSRLAAEVAEPYNAIRASRSRPQLAPRSTPKP